MLLAEVQLNCSVYNQDNIAGIILLSESFILIVYLSVDGLLLIIIN